MPSTWPKSSIHNSKLTSSVLYCSSRAIECIREVRDKEKLTEELIKLLPEDQRISAETALPMWWYNLRKNGGLRLTSLGYQIFVETLDLEHYSYSIDDPLLFGQQTVLNLDRKLQMPYYIVVKKKIPTKIVLFGSQEAVMIHLYGNLNNFLDNYSS